MMMMNYVWPGFVRNYAGARPGFRLRQGYGGHVVRRLRRGAPVWWPRSGQRARAAAVVLCALCWVGETSAQRLVRYNKVGDWDSNAWPASWLGQQGPVESRYFPKQKPLAYQMQEFSQFEGQTQAMTMAVAVNIWPEGFAGETVEEEMSGLHARDVRLWDAYWWMVERARFLSGDESAGQCPPRVRFFRYEAEGLRTLKAWMEANFMKFGDLTYAQGPANLLAGKPFFNGYPSWLGLPVWNRTNYLAAAGAPWNPLPGGQGDWFGWTPERGLDGSGPVFGNVATNVFTIVTTNSGTVTVLVRDVYGFDRSISGVAGEQVTLVVTNFLMRPGTTTADYGWKYADTLMALLHYPISRADHIDGANIPELANNPDVHGTRYSGFGVGSALFPGSWVDATLAEEAVFAFDVPSELDMSRFTLGEVDENTNYTATAYASAERYFKNAMYQVTCSTNALEEVERSYVGHVYLSARPPPWGTFDSSELGGLIEATNAWYSVQQKSSAAAGTISGWFISDAVGTSTHPAPWCPAPVPNFFPTEGPPPWRTGLGFQCNLAVEHCLIFDVAWQYRLDVGSMVWAR
jgi:hypothetical protein